MSHSGTRNQKQNIATNRGVFSVVFGDAGINGQRYTINININIKPIQSGREMYYRINL